MANDTTANVKVNVTSNLDSTNKEAEKLHNSLKAAANAAKNVRTPGPLRAAQAGIAASAGRESGLGRAVGVGKGAEARDFAEQAQGLGGLVRVYATFAANIFAVSAAFTALSRAYDTANLVKGLDQLGAASGKNLGSLAKQLVAATDGAISLREAMKAIAGASAAGLSGANILRLGAVAKQASQALGVDMSNAVDRLSRGITKLEPELLDELGIFTRVDKANQDYARSIGKSVSALTDFEKRQAFANAVLKEGEDKFGNIKIDANPYTKVLASIQNLSDSGLNLLNKVLGPIVNVLASSPTALAGTLAAIGTLLLRQAIPALSQYREGLKKAAEDSHKTLLSIYRDQAVQGGLRDAEAGKQALEQFKLAKDTQEKIAKIQSGGFQTKIGGNADKLIKSVSPFELSDKDIKSIEAKQKELSKRVDDASKADVDRIKNRLAEIAAIRQKAADVEEAAIEKNAGKDDTRFSHQTQLLRQLDAQTRASANRRIASLVAETAATEGPIAAYKKLNAAIAERKSGKMALDIIDPKTGETITRAVKPLEGFLGSAANGITRVKGLFTIATSAITTFVGAFQTWFMVIGLVIGALQVLDGLMSTAGKQAEDYSSALSGLESSIDSIGRTIEFLKNSSKNIISAESIQASANAFQELSDSTTRAAQTFVKLRTDQGAWEQLVDGFFDLFGRGQADKLATQLSGSIAASLKLIENGPVKEAAKKTFAELTNADPTNVNEMEKALRNLTNPEIAERATAIAKAQAALAKEASNSASTLTAAATSIKDTSKLVTDLNNSLKPTDIQGKLGDALISQSFGISKALKEPINGLEILKKSVDDVNFLSLLPPEFAKELANAKENIDGISESLSNAKKDRLKIEDKLAKTSATVETADPLTGQITTVVNDARAELENSLSKVIAEESKLKAAAADLVTKFSSLGNQVFTAGIDKIIVSLKGAFAEGGIAAARGYLGVIKSAGGSTAEQDGRLKQQEIDIQVKAIDAQVAQIKASTSLAITMEENNVLTKIQIEQAKMLVAASKGDGAGAANSALELERLTKESRQIDLKKGLINKSGKGLVSAFSDAAKSNDAELKDAAQSLAGYFTQIIGADAQKAKLGGQSEANKVQTKANVLQENADKSKRALDSSLKQLDIEKQSIALQQEVLGIFDEQYAKDKLAVDLEIARQSYLKDQIDGETKLAQLKLASGAAGVNQERLNDDIAKQEELNNNKRTAFEQTYQTTQKKGQFDILKGIEQIIAKERERTEKIREFDIQTQQSALSIDEARLSARQALGTITEENATIDKAALDTERTKLDIELESLKTLNARKAIEASRDTKLAGAGDNASLQEKIKKDAEEELKVLDAQSAKNAQLGKDKLAIIEITKNQGIEQAKINEHLKEQQTLTEILTNLTTNLATAFGEVGQAVGTAAKAIVDSAEKQYQINKKLAEDRKKYSDPKDADKLAKAESKAAYDIADAKLESYQTVLGASKKLFGEQTKMGKALAAAEKAMALARAVAAAQELATQLGITSASIAAKWTEIQTDGIGAVVKTLSSVSFPFNLAAAATVAGVVASLTGKNVQVPAGGTSAEQQSVQGTGQTYAGSKDGKPVDRVGGVLGDAKAKSEDVAKSIELMEKYSFKTLEFNNKSLDTLKAIQKNTEGLAGLLVTVKGLQSGSGFGTSEGSDPGKLFGLFGKSSTEILDAGIQLKGTFEQLAKGAGDLNQFENVKKKSSSLLGLVSSTSFSTNTKSLDDKVVSGIKDLFQSAADSVVSLGDEFGKESKDRLTDVLKQTTVDFKISTKGLSGAEIAKALEAEIGIALNGAVESVYPFVTEFQKVGEGLLTTLSRLDTDRNVVNRTLEGIGINFKDAAANAAKGMEDSTVSSIRMYESLIDLTGGLEEFTKKTSFFSDRFLTDSEKLAPVQAAVSKEFERLGIATDITREDFKKLVLGLDLTTESGQQTYANLMNVAEGFDLVASNSEKFNAAVLDKQLQIMKLTGETSKATNIERTNEINKLKQLSATEAAVLVPLQQQIYDIIDAEAARSAQLKSDIAVLQAQGKAYAALNLQRQEELRFLTATEKAQKIAVYDAENIAKVRSKDLTLLELQGNATYVLGLRREDELATMSEQEQAVQKLIYAEQDRAKIRAIEIDIVNALGMSYTGLLMAREKELAGLTDSEKALKTYLYKVQDQAKTDALNIELMDAQGNATGALLAKRKQELRGLSATDQSLKVRIWRLQDERKLLDIKTSQEQKIYTLLGNASAALAITRRQELDALDEQLRPAQEYIYALEDEMALKEQIKTAYEKESSALKDTIKGLKASSQALKDYRDSLLVGDKSILNPTQKYAEAKSQALKLAAIAQGPATTEAQIEARDNAISKLPSATDTWLEASRNLYASSETYSNDFGMALNILDSVSGALDSQQTDAEKQLSALEANTSILDIIKDNTKSSADLLKEYLVAQKATEDARVAAANAGSVAAGGINKDPTAQNVAATLDTTSGGQAALTGTSGQINTQSTLMSLINSLATSDPNLLYKTVTGQGITSQQVDALMGYAPGTALRWALEQGFPAFASGGIAKGMSIVGEKGPELVNFPAPTKVYSNSQTNDIANSNQALLQEMRALREEVAQLRQEQQEQTGHLITATYDSNAKNANAITEAANDTKSNWDQRVAVKLA